MRHSRTRPPTPETPKRRQRHHLPLYLGRLPQIRRGRPRNIQRPKHIRIEQIVNLLLTT